MFCVSLGFPVCVAPGGHDLDRATTATKIDPASQAAEKHARSFLQWLKPIDPRSFVPGPFEAQDELKPRPPKEKAFFRKLFSRAVSVAIQSGFRSP
jgi:hypothetical protein